MAGKRVGGPQASGRSERGKKRVTILDVAEDAGVSFAAVSKVLRNAYGVSDSLRARVNASIKKLGYTPNTAARGLRGRSFVLGTIFPDFRNPFFSDILAGVASALERTSYQTYLGIERHSNARALIQSMIDMQMDGLLLVGSWESETYLSEVGQRVPIVTVGHHLPNASSFDTVNNNDRQSGRLAVQHLVQNGFKRVVMLSLDVQNGTVIEEREAGFLEQMSELGHGDLARVHRAPQTLRDIQLAARTLLEGDQRPDAIFCWTDFVALEVMSVAKSMGLSIPDDVALVGHDNTMYCDFEQNSLTSIDQSGEQLGLQAARLLVERVEGRTESQHYVVQPRLVRRKSSSSR